MGHVHEDLVDGIDVNVLRGDIFQIDMIDLATDFDIPGHLRRRSHVVHGQRRGGLQRLRVAGGAGKGMVRRGLLATGVDVTDLLNNLKQTGASRDAVGL